jgi:hypothetical protein
MISRRKSISPAPDRKPHDLIEPLEARIAPASLHSVHPMTVNPTVTKISVTTLKDLSDPSGSAIVSLRDAITMADAATGPVEIVFGKTTPLRGVITLNATLGALPSITGDLTINGSGIIINAGNKMQGLSITGDTTGITINGLTIENGNNSTTGGDLSITGGKNIALNNVHLLNGRAPTGGGLYVADSGNTVTLTGAVITGNHAAGAIGNGSGGYAGQGGGIANMAGTLVIQGKSQISHNTATGGSGSAGDYNGASGAGGGIFNSATLSITSSTLSGNTATGGNGGVGVNYAYNAKTQTATTATNGGYGGNAYGGAIANTGGTLTIGKSIISGNTVRGGSGGNGGKTYAGTNGKAFYVANSSPYAATAGTDGGAGLNGGNGGTGIGGGIASNGPGTVSLTQSAITGNIVSSGHGGNGTAGGKGGNGGAGGTYAGNPYVAGYGGNGGYGGAGGNNGLAGGGGVYCNGTLTIKTSTISGNTVTAGKAGTAGAAGAAGSGYTDGGTVGGVAGQAGTAGVYLVGRGGGVDSEASTALLQQMTVAKNTAATGGGVSLYQDTSATVHNVTIASNIASTPTGLGGLFVALDSNNDLVDVISSIIVSTKGTSVDTTTFDSGSGHNITSGNPLLGPLALHASGSTLVNGVTQTMLPSHLGPAYTNPGSAPDISTLPTDQNGMAINPSHILIGSVQKFT